jgi:hypothetical protein
MKWQDRRRDSHLDTTKLSVETVAIERLFCSPANPRRNDPAVPHVAASIRRFGFRQERSSQATRG